MLLLASSGMAADIAIKASAINMDYMETSGGTNLDSEKANYGDIKGIEISIRGGGYQRSGARYINELSFSQNSGNSAYVGSLLYSPNGKYGDIYSSTSNKISEINYKIGATFPVSRDFSVGGQLFTGVRDWKRDLNDGNIETYFWGSYGLGGIVELGLFSGVTFSVTADLQKAYKPTMNSTSIGSTFTLGKTDGYKVGLHWVGNISQRIAFEMDYIYDYWNISRSNSVSDGSGYVYYEPDSKTNNQYIKAGFVFSF